MNKEVSNRQEKMLRKHLEVDKQFQVVQPPFIKGDVLVGNCIIECKTKTKEVKVLPFKNLADELREERIGMENHCPH